MNRRLPWCDVARVLREARGLTQKQFAEHLRVGRRTVQRWESGEAEPSREEEERLVAYCHDARLFARSDRQALGGFHLDEEALRDLIVEARLKSFGLQQPLASRFDDLWRGAQRTSRMIAEVAGQTSRGLAETRQRFLVGARIRITLRLERESFLTLLELDTTGSLFCLCPSRFAANPLLPAGVSYLPLPGSEDDAFTLEGPAGVERLVALLTLQPLEIDLSPPSPTVAARALDLSDLDALARSIHARPVSEWTSWATSFEVVTGEETNDAR